MTQETERRKYNLEADIAVMAVNYTTLNATVNEIKGKVDTLVTNFDRTQGAAAVWGGIRTLIVGLVGGGAGSTITFSILKNVASIHGIAP